MTRIFISAGEPSGDAHAGALASELRRLHPGLEIRALGGEKLAAAGAVLIRHCREVAVVGLVEVLLQYRRIKRVFDALVADLEKNRPDLLVLVDFPDFNLRLAKEAAKRKIPVVYYISPQVWAWRRGRVETLKRRVKKMVVILPFERGIYEAAGIPVAYVGHPLADHYDDAHRDAVSLEFRARHGIPSGAPLVGLLPGSRPGEVGRVLPALLGAARLLGGEFPAARFILPAQSSLPDALFTAATDTPNLSLVRGEFGAVLQSLDAVAVASGTATLECAWHGIPGAMVYKVAPPTYFLAKRLVNVEHVALANLVADLPGGARVYPELLQGDCSPGKIAAALRPLLADPARRARERDALAIIKQKIGPPGASRRAARAIAALLP